MYNRCNTSMHTYPYKVEHYSQHNSDVLILPTAEKTSQGHASNNLTSMDITPTLNVRMRKDSTTPQTHWISPIKPVQTSYLYLILND